MALHMLSTGITFTDFGNTGHTPVSELLGDYEYGTYTATFTPSTSGSISSNAGMRYIQIGVMVTVTGRQECSSSSSPAGAHITMSIPISMVYDSAADAVGSIINVSIDGSGSWNVFSLVHWGQSLPGIYGLTVANVNSNFRFQPHLNYRAALA